MTTDATLNGVALSSAVPDAIVLRPARHLVGRRRHQALDVPGRAGPWIFGEQPGAGTVELVDADSGETIDVTNPATGEKLGTIPKAGAAETRRAIEAANAAWPEWRNTPAIKAASAEPLPSTRPPVTSSGNPVSRCSRAANRARCNDFAFTVSSAPPYSGA